MSLTRAILVVTVASAALAAMSSSSACSATPSCTPEAHGLGSASRLDWRRLMAPVIKEGACAKPRLQVLASDADLRTLYDEIGTFSTADGGVPDAGESAGVDFSRERVIVREGDSAEGISWAVANGDQAVLGLLSCNGPTGDACAIEVIVVPSLVTRVDSRTCDPVGCGPPQQAQ